MPFTVEDGTGLAAANSYTSVTEADAFAEFSPWSDQWKCFSTWKKELALVFGTRWVDQRFRWYGAPLNAGVQALGFPRTKVFDAEGNEVAAGTIPTVLKRATWMIALEVAKATDAKTGAEELEAAIESSGQLRSFQIETLAIAFDTGGQVRESAAEALNRQFVGKRFPEIEVLLGGFGEFRTIESMQETLRT